MIRRFLASAATVATVALFVLALATAGQASNVRPPILYRLAIAEGAVSLACVQVNGAGPYECNGAYTAPLTDARVVRTFPGGSTVTYYHQAATCVDSGGNYYGKWACSWNLS